MTSNASLPPSSQAQTSEWVPASLVTSQTTVLVVEPLTIPTPHIAPHPPPQGHIFAAREADKGPGHACQITSHCPGGAESDEALAAFKTQVGDLPGYCSFLSSEVSRRLDPGNGTGNKAPPGAVETLASDACGLAGDAAAYPLYASLFAYQFCVAANQSDSRAQVMSRYAAADLPAWDAPTVGGGGLTAMVGFYISSRSGDLGPGCEAYGLVWAGGIQEGGMVRVVALG
ncbi:hypothetical protein SLS63_009865 [Diaporthe eres]|uniref:Uncharacterized protein n=1 Tax=Diaporthe eres TaxID=83184 RepID=A0ABR1NYF0_DIAER